MSQRGPWLDAPVCAVSFSPSFSHLLLASTAGSLSHCAVPEGLLTQAADFEGGEGVLDERMQGAGGFDGGVGALCVFSALPIACTGGKGGVFAVWRLPLLDKVM